jgi:2-polyprenyl-3-methyl-5-hydroxy-6-metoxy-1,4-benzoquinol methylase
VSVDRYDAERAQGELIAAGHEEAWGWSSPAGRIRAERRAAFLIESADLRPGVRCLELGCGTGEFTTRVVRSGCELTAVELSVATAEIARARTAGGAEIVVGNVETGEGVEGREFDAIVGVSVLHHVDLQATFANTFTKLRPGGRFAFSEPNLANVQVWAERRLGPLRRWRKVTPHETAFTAAGLRRAFENAGLIVEVAEPFEFLHPSTPTVLVGPVRTLERMLERTPMRAIAGSIRIAGRKP